MEIAGLMPVGPRVMHMKLDWHLSIRGEEHYKGAAECRAYGPHPKVVGCWAGA